MEWRTKWLGIEARMVYRDKDADLKRKKMLRKVVRLHSFSVLGIGLAKPKVDCSH